MYGGGTQSPLQQKENTPKAKSWNIALHHVEPCRVCSQSRCTCMNSSFAQSLTSNGIQTFSRSINRAPVSLLLPVNSRGRASAHSRPRQSNYLPLFQPESAPVSMTTWSLFCSVGLDIQSVVREGCRGATQQMHFSQQDALLLLRTAWKLVTQRRRSLEPPFFVAFLLFFFFSSSRLHGYQFLWQPVSCLLGYRTGSYLFLPPLSTCSCLCVTGCVCLYPAAGHELIIRTQGFSVRITKLWHHHISHTQTLTSCTRAF